ncbi:MAG: hypothetical protein COA47_15900 [Robiginitomaculum sp.]|nr:MAG: hypothetical protein COA47_15900 [Robiginitomaculum sp.]
MLLWITDTPDLLLETEDLVVRTPSELAAISPQAPTFVVIDVHPPQQTLINWATQRQRATLWWQPDTDVPTGHCSVNDTDHTSTEFIPLLSNLYSRKDFVSLAPNELELLICKLPYIRILTVPTEFDGLIDDQTGEMSYIIFRWQERSLDEIEQTSKKIINRFNIKNFCCLYIDETGPDVLITFSDQYHPPSYGKYKC